MALNVCHVITSIERGGAENQLLILCREQKQRGLQVKVIYLKGRPELAREFEELGILTERIPGSFMRQFISVRAHLKKIQPEVLHAHLPRAELTTLRAPVKTKVVISRHNCERFFPTGPLWISRVLSKVCLRRANVIIAISESVREFLIESGEIAQDKKIAVIHYGYKFTSSMQLSDYSHQARFSLISIGRLVAQKDYRTLLNAASLLSNIGIDYSWTILGEGRLENELKSLSASLGLESIVNWKGKVEDPNHYLLHSHVFVICSIYEGFGLVILEAINAGIPIVCSRIKPFEEILGEDYVGFFEVGNPQSLVSAILLSKSNPEKFIDQAMVVKPKFSASEMSNKVTDLYDIKG